MRIIATLFLVASAACGGNPPPLGHEGPAEDQNTVVVRLASVPAATPAESTIYIAGTFNGWNPGAPGWELTALPGGEHEITLPDSVRGLVQFKFTLGSWAGVETNATGHDVPNRHWDIPATGPALYTGTVAGWRGDVASTASASVSILSDAFHMPQLGRNRRIWLYLPPDYATTTKTYPVLYMHDGQNVFDDATSFAGEWGVDETLDSLHAVGDDGVIVVAIDNGGTLRIGEYTPSSQGHAYVEFLVHTLKPYIDAHYRTRPDREHTGIAGSSLGGLISLYAALTHADVFGLAGVFSPALWFDESVFELAGDFDPDGPRPRLYFVTGAQEGSDPERYVREHERMIETLVEAGFEQGSEVTGFIREDGTHSEWFWRREFPAAYQWLYVLQPQATPAHPTASLTSIQLPSGS